MNRVVVTGLGVISPVGNNAADFWRSLCHGVCGIGPITRFDTADHKAKLAAEVKGFDPLSCFASLPEARRADLYTQYAMAAAKEAMEASGLAAYLTAGRGDPTRMGVYVGSGIGGMSTFTAETLKLHDRGPARVSPLFIPMMIGNMAAGSISIRYGLKGPTLPVVTACATSSHTIGEAFRAIKHGYADAVIAGGAEATITPLAMAGFVNCKALCEGTDPTAASLPFDARRAGFVMGEGAAMVILERYEHALSRGASILAEICGYGNTADAYHVTAPDPSADGAARAMRLAMDEAGLTPADASALYVNAHGTGTPMNDKTETAALKSVFGAAAYDLHISSTKSMTGHMLGATGAVEAVASVLALRDGIVPPTINLTCPDPVCDLCYTPGQAVHAELRAAMSASLGFGGHNACLVFRRLEESSYGK